MSVHTHTMRNWCVTAFVLLPVPLLLGWRSDPEFENFDLAQVSGRVTCADQPFGGTIYFLPDDEGRQFAMGPVNPDGSFQLYFNGRRDRRGAVPGRYRVFIRPRLPDKTGSRVASKYQNAHTSDLLVPIGPDWNHVHLTLH